MTTVPSTMSLEQFQAKMGEGFEGGDVQASRQDVPVVPIVTSEFAAAVFSFDWCDDMRVLASCGSERRRQILTADRAQITVWDLETGAKVTQFRPAKQLQQSQQRLGTGIAHVALDQRGTRLIVGTDRGCCVVWNMGNFQVCAVGDPGDGAIALGDTEAGEGSTVTALMHCRRKGGWFICAAAGPRWEPTREDAG
eukprot:gene31215-1067_t